MYAHRKIRRSAFLVFIMEKYSFREKKQRIINESMDTRGLKRVATVKTTNIPHHVLIRRETREKSLSPWNFLTERNAR